MQSMTGYGRAVASWNGYTLTVQVSSVNRRTLDLSLSLPPTWEGLESVVSERVRQRIVRGKVQVRIELTGEENGSRGPEDEAVVKHTLARLESLARQVGIPFAPTVDVLWKILRDPPASHALPPWEEAEEEVMAVLEEALTALVAMRAREGAALLSDLLERWAILSAHIGVIAGRAPHVPVHYREQLHRRLREAGLSFDLDDERVLKEIALFADRCDISEELTRFRSHLLQLEALLKSESEIGRKADFILQEMGREVHTMGAKGNDLTIARHVIEMKNELERIREQIANVE